MESIISLLTNTDDLKTDFRNDGGLDVLRVCCSGICKEEGSITVPHRWSEVKYNTHCPGGVFV